MTNFQPLTPKVIAPAMPGRPKVNVKPFIIKPTDRVPGGFEYLNTVPKHLADVHTKYLKKYQLPPTLQPRYISMPAVLENKRRVNISKGFKKPRSHNG
jgi:hypothetical protein